MHLRSITALGAVVALLAIPAAARADYGHVVLPGETLTSVAADDGLTVASIAAANGLSPTADLIAGQVLEIPPQTSYTQAGSSSAQSYGTSAAQTSASTSTVAGDVSYIVQPGDTLSAIAARADTTVSALAALNGLDPAAFLLSGAVIELPVGGGTDSSNASYVSTSSTTAPAVASSQSAGPYPTAQYSSSSQIADIAEANGVSPSLAQAIGWQESGFDNDEVSDTGAVGVMQIEPSTWSWIQQNLSGGTLQPASVADNVRGGVLLLRDLVGVTGSDSLAAAGYYQGIASVDKYGMYPSTQQYVADVMALQSRFGG